MFQRTGSGKTSDKARILQCSFRPNPMASFYPGMTLTRMSDGMTAPVGTLVMTVGTSGPFVEIPTSADVKMLVINEDKNVFEASARLQVRKDEIIGVIEVPIPYKPYESDFICRAWITAAYYNDGSVWVNKNASALEADNKKYIKRMLTKLK